MNTQVNKFRYVITNRLGIMQVKPLGESNFTIEWSREEAGKLDYEKSLPSKVVFTGMAYQNLLKLEKSIYRCDYVAISVERRCVSGGVETWVPWHTGRFSLNDGDWDLDGCKVELKMDNVKQDQCFEDNKSKEMNIFQVTNRRTVKLSEPNIVIEKITYEGTESGSMGLCNEFYWGGTGVPSDFGYSYYYYIFTRNLTLDTCEMETGWARETVLIDCAEPSPGVEWILVDDGCPGGQKKYARPVRTYGCLRNDPDFGAEIQTTTVTCNIVGDVGSNTEIDNGVALDEIIEMFMNEFCSDYTFVSNFFQINPDTPTAINYVTGARSKTRYITVFQKSDVKRPNVSANASIANLTLDKLFEFLINMYNLQWRIEGNILRMEHVSYFGKNEGLDFTLPKYNREMIGKRRYSYQTEEIPSQEEYKFMEASLGDFQGLPIVYSGACVTSSSKQNKKTYAVDKVTTDVELVLSNPDPESKVVDIDGFVFMACDFDGVDYYLITESPILGGSSLNNSMAWAQLHRDYHKYNRPLKSGVMNGVDTEFLSVKPTKKGISISVRLCCDDVFNPDDTIKTNLGIGIVDKATFSFKNETLSVDLLYPADLGLITNTAPVAENDVVNIYIDTPTFINVLANDSDPDADGTISGVTIQLPPTHGTAVIQSDKRILYTPNAGYTGSDNIAYQIFDDWGEPSNIALIAIVVSENQMPVANPDSYEAVIDTVLNIPAPGVFSNDSDDGAFTLESYDVSSIWGGIVVLNPDGSFTYTPPPGYTGNDLFGYTIEDAEGQLASTTVTITVRNPDNPIAFPDNYSTAVNTNLIIAAPGVLANDTDPGGTLTTVATTIPTTNGGTVAMGSDGSFVYYPASGFTGTDSFNYTVENGTGSDIGSVSITVNPNIYVHLQQVEVQYNSLTRNCPDLEPAGYEQSSIFRLKFYSNSAGTIPFNVTSLNVNIRVTGGYYDMPGMYENDSTEMVSGTQFDILGGGQYVFSRVETDCSGGVNYINESVTLLPGAYTII